MKAGDTFRPAEDTVDKYVHLWVIISDPEQDSDWRMHQRLETLIQARDNGDLVPDDPMPPDVLERIRKRSSFSTKMDPDLWEILERQGLV